MNKLWIVGKIIWKDAENWNWLFQGIFDSEQKAIDACPDEFYFIGPAELNVKLPNDDIRWPGSYYPKG